MEQKTLMNQSPQQYQLFLPETQESENNIQYFSKLKTLLNILKNELFYLKT